MAHETGAAVSEVQVLGLWVSDSVIEMIDTTGTHRYLPIPRCWCLLLVCLLLASACTAPADGPDANPVVGVDDTLTPLPTLVPWTPVPQTPVPQATATVAPSPTSPLMATWTAELEATVSAGRPRVPSPARADMPSSDGIDGIAVLPVPAMSNVPPTWIVYTYGLRTFDATEDHYVAIYTRTDNTWQEVTRFILSTSDYVDVQGVSVVHLGSDDFIWIAVESGVGAHGGCFDLLRFDGRSLFSDVASCNTSPDAGEIRDLTGDGTATEIVLNESDNYVFCYACGVRLKQFRVLRWNGAEIVEVQLQTLPDSAPEAVRILNNRAVELAQAGLWKDAQQTIASIASPITDEAVAWNTRLIELHAQARADQVQHGTYPLLEQIFYGDYAAALEVMRPFTSAELFAFPNPLLRDTVAEGWESELSAWIVNTTLLAIQAEPDLAAAFFLRGWAIYLLDPRDPAVLDNLKRAALIDPRDPLFYDSVAYLEERRRTDDGLPPIPGDM